MYGIKLPTVDLCLHLITLALAFTHRMSLFVFDLIINCTETIERKWICALKFLTLTAKLPKP